jgi:hypothetical protein
LQIIDEIYSNSWSQFLLANISFFNVGNGYSLMICIWLYAYSSHNGHCLTSFFPLKFYPVDTLLLVMAKGNIVESSLSEMKILFELQPLDYLIYSYDVVAFTCGIPDSPQAIKLLMVLYYH